MTKALLSSSCLAGLILAASPAAAQDFKFDVSGFVDVAPFYIDQGRSGFGFDDPNGGDILLNGKVILRGTYLTEDGIELGARAEVRVQSGERSNSTTGRDDWVQLEKAYLWAESGLGRLELGAQDGIADQFQVAPPSVTKSLRIDDPLMMPVSDSSGAFYRPAGLMLRTDLYASDQSAKIAYRSPRLFGLQLGVSYTPEFETNFERFIKHSGDDLDQQSDIWEFGVNYDSNLDNVRLRASLVYLTASNERARDTTSTLASPWRSDDLSEWGGALSVKFQGFTLGGAYRRSNARGGFIDHAPVVLSGGASDTDIWSLGAMYEFDSWKIGANYVTAETNVGVEDPAGGRIETQDGAGWQVAAAYTITTDIQIAAGYQNYSFDASSGLNPFGLADTRPVGLTGGGYVGDLDADIIFTEISLGF